MGIFRPSEVEIAREAEAIMAAKVRALTWLDVVEVFDESGSCCTVLDALRHKDHLALGQAVWGLLEAYYELDAMREAEQWADRMEDDALHKAGRRPDYLRIDE